MQANGLFYVRDVLRTPPLNRLAELVLVADNSAKQRFELVGRGSPLKSGHRKDTRLRASITPFFKKPWRQTFSWWEPIRHQLANQHVLNCHARTLPSEVGAWLPPIYVLPAVFRILSPKLHARTNATASNTKEHNRLSATSRPERDSQGHDTNTTVETPNRSSISLPLQGSPGAAHTVWRSTTMLKPSRLNCHCTRQV